MPWIAFAILLYICTALQTSVAPLLAVHTIRPDFLAIVAAYYCLAAKASDALIAGWLIGFAMDLTSLGYQNHSGVGLYSLTLGLLAWGVVKIRDLTFRESVLTQLIFTFLLKFALSVVGGLFVMYVLRLRGRWNETITAGLFAALYTALLAPYGHWVLWRLRGLLGIGVAKRFRVG